MAETKPRCTSSTWTRRSFLKAAGLGTAAVGAGLLLGRYGIPREEKTETFIASVSGYDKDLKTHIIAGLRELGIQSGWVKGKRVLLKPNLVEPHRTLEHINTHPLVIRAAVEAFLSMGAAQVMVAEGSGHRRDNLLVLEESGLADVLAEDKIPFTDLNLSSVVKMPNQGKASKLEVFYFPEEILKADIVVSMAKMKTHHWAGVTLSMKNLFGVMPGIVYGWPEKRAALGRHRSMRVRYNGHPETSYGHRGWHHRDGRDGPIMGDAVRAGVIVMGTNLPAVDATCARIMKIDPEKIKYLKHASGRIGTIHEKNISQRGELIATVQRGFKLIENIPAHHNIRA